MLKITNLFFIPKPNKRRTLRFALALVFTLTMSLHRLLAQDLEVTGVVYGEDGASLIGVNVVLKNTSTGTVTDVDGKYAIKVPADGTLVFSYIGYVSEEVSIENRTKIDITLVPSIGSLQEVVVVGYGVQRKSDLTGAVSSVKAEDIESMPLATTDQALQGRAAGVTVTSNSGSPGTPMQIRVRGVGTINDASPLFVVDGFPVGDISFLNPADIASMEVLKDASASAIYGSRGANGVILITTKSGKKTDSPMITADAYYGVSDMWKKPKMLNASQWAMLKNESLVNAGLSPLDELNDYESLGEGTDWIDEITRKAKTTNLNVAIQGGSDKITYFLSANNYSQEGIINKSDFSRTSVRINTAVQLKDWFKAGENLTIEGTKSHRIYEGDEWSAVLIQAISIDPITPVRRPNGNFAPSDYVDMQNPVAHIDRTNATTKGLGIIGNGFAEINPFKDLTFRSSLGISFNNGNDYDFEPTFFISGSESNSVSAVSRGNSLDRSWSWSNTLTYAKVFGNHDISLMAGTEASQDYSEWFGTRATNLLKEDEHLRYIDNATNPNATSYGSKVDKRIQSYFGRLNYVYADKYLLTANIRRDGSSAFGKDSRYGTFPSFSVGWRVSDESFMSGVPLISNLKLRAGWGQIGNDKIGSYRYITQASSGMRYVFGDIITDGSAFLSMGNTELHWETSTTTNVGLDLGIFKNKITLSAEYYVKETSDMLLQAPTPAHVGLQEDPWRNIGKMKNNGFELELNYQESSGDFEYDLGLNFATYKNEVTDLGSKSSILDAPLRDNGYVTKTVVGQPIAQFLGYKTDGLFQNWDEVNSHVDNEGNLLQPNAAPGDIKYAKGSDGNLYYGNIGNPLPDFTFGFNATLKYQNFDLVLFLQGVYGNEVFNGTKVYTDRPDATHNMSVRMLNRWTGEGSTNDARYPRLNAADANNLAFSDRYVEDGSYLRIKNLQIGYTLPEQLSKIIAISKFRVYVGGTNLYTLTGYDGFDPEIGTGYFGSLDLGVDRATYPQPRTFLVGLNLTL